MEKAWILVNPAVREGLPNSYLEAAAHRTAILSYVDPDGFASKFGFHAVKNNFEEGLTFLLKNEEWKSRAEKGYAYVNANFELQAAMDKHEDVYRGLL
jgi:glycosyltransferase involved in cell wall biosynthesis